MPGIISWSSFLVDDSNQSIVGIQNPNGSALMLVKEGAVKLPRGATIGVVGDSFGARSSLSVPILSASVLNGVMTVNTTSSHGLSSGVRGTIAGAAQPSQRVKRGVITRTGTNTFTIPAPGAPDGTVTVAAAARSGMSAIVEQFSEEGIFCHLNRLSGGGFNMAFNNSQPGYTVVEIVALWDELVTPYLSEVDAVYFNAGYNSIAQSETASQILAAFQGAIAKTPIPLMISNIWAVKSGTSADTAAKLQTLLAVNRGLKKLCEASTTAAFIDNFSATVDPATGYAKASMILGGSDNIHPSPMGSYTSAKLFRQLLVSQVAQRQLVSSTFDSVATDSTNVNIARNGLVLTTTGGNAGGLTATAPGDETTAVAGGAGANWTIGSVSLASGNVFIKPASSGIGNAQCLRAVADAAADQGRISLTLTNSDVVIGAIYDVSFRVRLTTAFNASNKTPVLQNVRALQTQVAITVDAVTYTTSASNPASVAASATYVAEDFDVVVVVPRVLVPAGAAVTLFRVDAILHFDGAGSAQIEVSQLAVERVP